MDASEGLAAGGGEVRNGGEANIADPEGIGCGPTREVGSGRGAGVVEIKSVAVIVANEGIEITVVIDIFCECCSTSINDSVRIAIAICIYVSTSIGWESIAVVTISSTIRSSRGVTVSVIPLC